GITALGRHLPFAQRSSMEGRAMLAAPPLDTRGDWLRSEGAATSEHPGGLLRSLPGADSGLPLFLHPDYSVHHSAVPLVSLLRLGRCRGGPDPTTGCGVPSGPARRGCDRSRLLRGKVPEG